MNTSRQTRVRLLVAAGAVAVCSLVGGVSVAATASDVAVAESSPKATAARAVAAEVQSEETPRPEEACIKMNDDGVEYWDGDVSRGLRAAEEELAQFVSDHPELTTMMAFCSDRQGLLLYAPEVTPEVQAAVASAERHLAPGETIGIVISNASNATLQAAIDRVVRDHNDDLHVAGFLSLSVTRYGNIAFAVSTSGDPAKADEIAAELSRAADGADVILSRQDSEGGQFLTSPEG